MAKKKTSRVWLWLLGAFFFFYSLYLNLSPLIFLPMAGAAMQSQMAPVLVISVLFLLLIGPLQLFIGRYFDRLGAGKSYVIAAILTGFGCLLMSATGSLTMMMVGRIALGLGTAFSFIGLVYITLEYFSPNMQSLLIGVGNSVGLLGAFLGAEAFIMSHPEMHWLVPFILFGVLGLIFAFLFAFYHREVGEAKVKHEGYWTGIGRALADGKLWYLTAISIFFFAGPILFAAVWGIPYLTSAYGMSSGEAAFATGLFYLGWLFGGPLMGLWGDSSKRRNCLLCLSVGISFLCLFVVVFFRFLPVFIVDLLLLALGFFLGGQLFVFWLAGTHKAKERGVALGMVNGFTFLGVLVIQFILSLFINTGGPNTSVGQQAFHRLGSLQAVFSVLLLLMIVAFFMAKFLRKEVERKRRPTRRTTSRRRVATRRRARR